MDISDNNTVLTTNKERTNKERTNKKQITFFKKIYCLLIRNENLEKKFSIKPIADVFTLIDYFWRKAHLYDRFV